ncbi:MAG: SDR family NAD(P)-dependent oxidoreductase, partial [Pseudomonadota bacterium]
MTELTNKTVIITGASQGIGAATATFFAEHGAKVVLAARSTDAIEALADQINLDGGQALAVTCDVANWDD